MTETLLLPEHTAAEGHQLTPGAVDRVNESLGFVVDHSNGPSVIEEAAQGAPVHMNFAPKPQRSDAPDQGTAK